MRKLNTFIAIVTILWLWSGPASAQEPPFVLFGPQVGVGKSDTDTKLVLGAALRMRFLPALAVEGSVNYREENFVDDALTVRSWPLQVTGMFYPLPFAYGAMGVGWYMTTLDFDPDPGFLDDDTQSEFGWHFGGGIELPLGSVVRLAGDIRYVFIDYNFEAVPGSDEIDHNFYMATAGLLFRL